MVALLLKACVGDARRVPALRLLARRRRARLKRERHLGFAADTPNGLVVPVIRDVDTQGPARDRAELTELSGKARAGKLGAEGDQRRRLHHLVARRHRRHRLHADRQPAAGRDPRRRARATKPVWNGSEFEPRLMLPLSLSYDHRVIDGAAAARFCVHLAGRARGPAKGPPLMDVLVPDIGDFTDVPVIEILVEVGQEVAEEDPLVVLESDKATMEVPSPSAGKVGELLRERRGQGPRGVGAGAGWTVPTGPSRLPPRSRPPSRSRRATTTRSWSFWAPASAATPPPSAPPTSAWTSSSSSATSASAASA